MTTIAYDGRYLVADGRVCEGTIIISEKFIKIVSKCGNVHSFAGSVPYFLDYLEWVYSDNMDLTKLPKYEDGSVRIFQKMNDQLEVVYSDLTSNPIIDSYAIGSGGNQALCAMRLGKNAFQAIMFAHKYDTATGRPYCYVDLTDPKLEVKLVSDLVNELRG